MHPDDHQNISNKTFVQAILNNPFLKNNLKKKKSFWKLPCSTKSTKQEVI